MVNRIAYQAVQRHGGYGYMEEYRVSRLYRDVRCLSISAGSRYGCDDYVSAGCGMGYEVTMYLLEKGVRVTGTDAWSWDAPFIHTEKRYRQSHDFAIIWEGHKAGKEIGYCHLEKLHNLEELPSSGFLVSCFPVKIRKA